MPVSWLSGLVHPLSSWYIFVAWRIFHLVALLVLTIGTKKLQSVSDSVGKALPGNTRVLGSAPGSEHCIDSRKAPLFSHPKSVLYILFLTAGSPEYAQNLHNRMDHSPWHHSTNVARVLQTVREDRNSNSYIYPDVCRFFINNERCNRIWYSINKFLSFHCIIFCGDE